MTKRFSTTDLKGRFGHHEFQRIADLTCPYCKDGELWLEVVVEHLERNSASRAQRLYCASCEVYFERSPANENLKYEVSSAFRTTFRKTAPYEPGEIPTRAQATLDGL